MRLINADKLENYAYELEFGTKDEIENWIAEISIPVDVKIEYEEELKELCWKVLESCMNVIKTEPTAYDMDKVVDLLEEHKRSIIDRKEMDILNTVGKTSAKEAVERDIEIVKSGGIE